MIDEARDAKRLLAGLENGSISTSDAGFVSESIDHVLVYVIVKFLREVYPASDPAATSVLDRVVALTSTGPAFVRKSKEGEEDPVSKWFESEYSYRDFRGRGAELIDLVVDKLDS